jgi:isopenicillin N synthase-like dioxygenase
MSWGLMSHCLKQICAALIHKILSALALALPSLSESYLSDLHSASLFQLRLLHYPAIQKRVLSKTEATRISAHTDFGTLTLLWQDEVGGLEIMRPPPDAHSTGHGSATTDVHKISGAEEFIPVPPVPGAVLVNVGDLMERWSNGRWRSAVHRVGPPPQSRMTRRGLCVYPVIQSRSLRLQTLMPSSMRCLDVGVLIARSAIRR